MAALSNTPPHGVRAIQQIRGRTGPSARQLKLKDDTYNYFLTKVDPIISACITYLLCEQPVDVAAAMISYFRGYTGPNYLPETTDRDSTATGKPRKEMKLFLATYIAPIVSKLMNRIAVSRPENVIEYMCSEIISMMSEADLSHDIEQKGASSKPLPRDAEQKEVPLKPQSGSKTKSASKMQPVSSDDKVLSITVLGCAGAGKTTIINAVQGIFEPVRPTVGFRPISMMLSEGCKVRFFDLGGGKKIRNIWDQYYHDAHAFIYVFDAAANPEDMDDAVAMFNSTVSNAYVHGKPMLVFANKQDLSNAVEAGDLQSRLQGVHSNCFFHNSSAFIAEKADAGTMRIDDRIESSLETLLGLILNEYDILNKRVLDDSKLKAIEEQKKRFEKERKVLKSKIASAFIDSISADILSEMNVHVDKESFFTEEEGLTFLAAEVGEESGLSPVAKACAKAVGYQRLALQMIGSLKMPISKKKQPLEWDEIFALLRDIRSELGLTN
jgi:ADP-ribosylation factor-like protein 13B